MTGVRRQNYIASSFCKQSNQVRVEKNNKSQQLCALDKRHKNVKTNLKTALFTKQQPKQSGLRVAVSLSNLNTTYQVPLRFHME